MALSNTDGNYLKVVNVDIRTNKVYFQTFKNVEVRNAPTQFDLGIEGLMHCGKLPDEIVAFTSTGNLEDDMKVVGYAALKHEPPFNGASGETWTDC